MADTETAGEQGRETLKIDSLPDIGSIVIPECKVMSTRIRWLHAMGYKPAEISKYLMIKYQQVRNVITTQPKRAAREDLPPLVLTLREPVDDIQAIMDRALDDSIRAGRLEGWHDDDEDEDHNEIEED